MTSGDYTDDSTSTVIGSANLYSTQGNRIEYSVPFTAQSHSATLSFLGSSAGSGGTVVAFGEPHDTMILENVVTLVCDEDWYRYGHNGQMKVNEIAGLGNHYTALYWEYDSRNGGRWNQDPIHSPSVSPYAVFDRNPIWKNDLLGDDVKLYDQAKKEGTEIKDYVKKDDVQKVGNYNVIGLYENNNGSAGKLIGYQAYKEGRLDYEMQPGDLKNFKDNGKLFSSAADLYNSGSDNLKQVGLGIVTGDMKAVRNGLAKENKAAWSNPFFVATFGLSVVNAGIGLYETAYGGRSGGTDIVGTNHTDLLPTQDYVNPNQVAIYANQLRSGAKIEAINAYEVNGRLYIEDGHHRYVASQLTGIPVPVIIRKGGGPVGYKDWSQVSYQTGH